MKLVDLPAVQALTTREKLQLVDELWQEVAHDMDSLEITDEEKKLLDERWANFLNDPSRALTLDQFNERIKNLRA
jgi:putative addiction module component (TIGR02574 family)